MAAIELDLAHSYKPLPRVEGDYALLPLKVRFRDGGAYALLGPSGCGKTTMLNIMSGLVTPSEGRVLFGDRDVTHLPTEARNIAQVFQFPVIYDTMTVAQNLAFPLKNRGMAAAAIKVRVGQIAELLELSHLLNLRAQGLSADQKQKISLGRGLVRSDVSAVLFDEPLTVIDPHLKWQLRRKLKEIHNELKITLIYVTHDQIEALTFADEILVMDRGQVVQQGSAKALFEKPAHTFVGHFIGSPGMNFLSARHHQQSLQIEGLDIPVPAGLPLPEGEFKIGIRPEYLRPLDRPPATALPTATSGPSPAIGALPARVIRVQNVGAYSIVSCQLAGTTVKMRLLMEEAHPVEGENLALQVFCPQTCIYVNERLKP